VQGIITSPSTRHICYCHSPARYLWDWTHEYRQENRLTGLKGFCVGLYLRYLREWNRLSAHRVDRWLANSRTVADRIAKYYRKSAEVVYPPVDLTRVKLSPKTHQNYFLIVSQLTPYKKIDRAIAVFNKLRRQLVIVGEGPERAYLTRLAGPTVELLGRQSDATVAELLRHTRGFILPGEEDFGIAPVEALAAGCPVLALARGGATETVTDGKTGVLYADPTTAGLEAGLARFLTLEAAFQPAKLRASAKRFDKAVFITEMQRVVAEEWRNLQKREIKPQTPPRRPAIKAGKKAKKVLKSKQ
jgi:glycosyltransferase involved in cell wall biosynthesis